MGRLYAQLAAKMSGSVVKSELGWGTSGSPVLNDALSASTRYVSTLDYVLVVRSRLVSPNPRATFCCSTPLRLRPHYNKACLCPRFLPLYGRCFLFKPYLPPLSGERWCGRLYPYLPCDVTLIPRSIFAPVNIAPLLCGSITLHPFSRFMTLIPFL